MPVARYTNTPTPFSPKKQYEPTITDTEYKHSIVQASRMPLGALLTHIEGTSWTVDYYSQIVGQDEELSTFDPSQKGAYQQYLQINRYELKLQGPLSSSVDPVDQTLNLTGNAIVYPYMKPNYGDAFIADIGDGNAGLFTVTEVEKKSMFKQACYEIQFVLADYLTKELEDNITSKVVKETHFVKDFMTYGQNPIIATSEVTKYNKLVNIKQDALSDYLHEFYSLEFKTLLVPNKSNIVYDPFLVRLISNLFDKTEHKLLHQISHYNADDQQMTLYPDIWECLIKREPYMLRTAFRKFKLVNTKALSNNIFLQSMYWSGIKSVLLPTNYDYINDDFLGLNCVNANTGFLGNVESNPVEPTTVGEAPLFPDMNQSSSYLFSDAFWEDNTQGGLSHIERIVSNYLNEEANDPYYIISLLEKRHEWTKLQRFYYVPVLLLLVIHETRVI